MKRFSKMMVVVAALGALSLTMTGAQAAGAIAGVVDGNVHINEGLPLAPGQCQHTTYTFQDVAIQGSITDGAGRAWAGLIDVSNVSGASTICEDGAAGKGTVNSAGNGRASFSGTNAAGTVSGRFHGTYERHGSVVLVDLLVTDAKICNPTCGATFSNNVFVEAQFTPTNVNPSSLRAFDASFAGTFHTDG